MSVEDAAIAQNIPILCAIGIEPKVEGSETAILRRDNEVASEEGTARTK